MRRIILVAGIAFILLNLLPTRVLVINGQNIVQPPKTALNAKIVRIDPSYKPKHISEGFVRDYVIQQAKKSGINPVVADFIVKKESNYDILAIGDDGVSVGLFQFNLKANPQITRKCAEDLQCSTKTAMKWILAGRIQQWSVYRYCRQWYQDCPF